MNHPQLIAHGSKKLRKRGMQSLYIASRVPALQSG